MVKAVSLFERFRFNGREPIHLMRHLSCATRAQFGQGWTQTLALFGAGGISESEKKLGDRKHARRVFLFQTDEAGFNLGRG